MNKPKTGEKSGETREEVGGGDKGRATRKAKRKEDSLYEGQLLGQTPKLALKPNSKQGLKLDLKSSSKFGLLKLSCGMMSVFSPPEKISLSEWAAKYRVLPAESSGEPGRWRNERVEYMRYIMDCLSDSEVEQVSLMSSVQVAKTETQFNALFYFADQNAGPMMILFSTQDMAKDYSKTRMSTSADLMPQVRDKLGTPKTRNSSNTILLKRWKGGYLKLTGANSPTEVSGKPIKILLCDEVDRYREHSLEGNVFDRAKDRTTAFPFDKKIFVTSSPSTKGFSIIAEEFERGEKHYYHVPCPQCGEYHRLIFENIKWRGSDHEEAKFKCPACGSLFDDHAKNIAVQKGRWVPVEPLKETKQRRHLSFQISALYSPWKSLSDIVKAYIESNDDPAKYKGFINTILGEVYEEADFKISEKDVEKKREDYDAEIPEGVLILTSGADVQPDRIEGEIVGWAEGEESWSIDYKVFFGDPNIEEGKKGSPWDAYTAWRRRAWKNKKGSEFVVHHACIDSQGHNTQAVYNYVKKHRGERVFAIRGVGGEGKPFVGGAQRKLSGKRGMRPVDVYNVGVDSIKSLIYNRLTLEEKGAGYNHFPVRYPEEYFIQLLAERKKTIIDKRGRKKEVWIVLSGRRNEALDCRVYAFAALVLANPAYDRLAQRLKKEEAERKERQEAERAEQRNALPEKAMGPIKEAEATAPAAPPKPKVRVIKRIGRR